ncbi:MAG: T9SS type A sorting domain-containing protein, partial [bacterium]
ADNSYVGAAWVYTRSNGVWTQQGNKLVGSGATGLARQGVSVALSADGNTAVVGGIRDNNYVGAAWVYTRTNGVWTQQGNKLVGSDVSGTALFGWSIALSGDGNTAIVGGTMDNSNAGAAWVFKRTDSVWTQQGNKLVGTGAVNPVFQGTSVALSSDGNTAIVGGPYDDAYTGAAWVYTRSDSVWTQQGNKLVGTGTVGAANQGGAVSLSSDGNTAIVGGSADDTSKGAVWVFTRSGVTWNQQGTKLVGTGAMNIPYGAAQGYSVALSADGNTALSGGFEDDGGKGATWVFTRGSVGTWTQQGNKLVGTGAVNTPYPALQGYAVALSSDGTTAIVGGPNDAAQSMGAAWVFIHDTVLPIQLVNFTGTHESHTVRLNWTTLSEINNYGFEIQKSDTTQEHYLTVSNSFIPGHGTTNEPQHYSFVDSNVTPSPWYYRLKQIDLGGDIHYSEGIRINTLTSAKEKEIPTIFSLSQNYPNPFNPSTTIRYTIPRMSRVSLKIYNVLGQEVATLVNNIEEPGYKTILFNGNNLASGVYIYRLEADGFVEAKKLLLLK